MIFSVMVLVFGLGAGAFGQGAAKNPDAGQARAALDVLKDDKKRAELIRVLEAMAKAQPAPVPAPAAAPEAKPVEAPKVADVVPLQPDGLGAQLIAGASARLSLLSDDIVRMVNTATDFPLIWYWLKVLMLDASTKALLLDVAWRLASVLVLALLVQAGVRRALAGAFAALGRRAPQPAETVPAEAAGIAEAELGQTERLPRRMPGLIALLRRAPIAVAGLLLDLLPVVGLLAAGYAAMTAGLAREFAPRTVTLGVLHAVVAYEVVMAVARMLFAGRVPGLTLVPVEAGTAAAALRSVRGIAGLAIYGVTFADTAVLFGMYPLAYETVLKLLWLAVAVLMCATALRLRAGVAGAIRGFRVTSAIAASVRDRIAESWHVVACLYLLSLWLVWALGLPDGFSRLLRLTLVTGVVLGLARVASHLLVGALHRTLDGDGSEAETGGLSGRLKRYHPAAYGLGRLAIGAVTLVALLEAWGVPALSWFTADALGGRLVAALVNLGVTILVSLATWEAANLAIARHLARLAAEHQAARSARLRTLLPMLRTTLLVSICLVAGLMALSEIGVNIAPLLAGAGVVGLAIGFGSQKLVQDIITGLFLLLENAMQVGDTVTLGGLSGTVENLSIRTIRLRALDGSVHIIPFSAVTTVTNMTRDFGYAVIDVPVGLNEPPERITALVKEIAADMRNDPAWASAMTGDLDVMGVDSFQAQSYTLRTRLRTTPGSRWGIVREMNRRIKDRFDAEAIESPITSYRALGLGTPAPL